MIASVLPITYRGDPAIRGLAGLPTMMTASDVEQGAGGDSNVLAVMTSAQRSFSTAVQTPTNIQPANTQTTSAFSPSSPDSPQCPILADPVVCAGMNIGGAIGSTVGNAASGVVNSGSGCPNILLHPVDAVGCYIDRSLFGILAIGLILLGVWIFSSDNPVRDGVKAVARAA